jgi:hypothetical protein
LLTKRRAQSLRASPTSPRPPGRGPHRGLALDLMAGCGKIRVMSRHRTTTKLYRASAKAENPAPLVASGQTGATEAGGVGDSLAEQREDALETTLAPWLAAEATRRDASEQRTADMVAHYFKLTLAILCLNMVVGGANVAALFVRSGELRTVVVAQPAPAQPPAMPAPLPSPAPQAAAAVSPASPAFSATLPATQPSPTPSSVNEVPLLGKAPLLGKPARPAASPGRAPEVGRPVRAVTPPPKTRPVFPAGLVDEQPAPKPAHVATERW